MKYWKTFLLLLSLILLAACGDSSDAASSPDRLQPVPYRYSSGIFDSIMDNISDSLDKTQDSDGLWHGVVTLMEDECQPENWGTKYERWLRIEVSGEHVTIMDEAGRIHEGLSNRLLTIRAEWQAEPVESQPYFSSIAIIGSNHNRTAMIYQEQIINGNSCFKKYRGSFEWQSL